MGLFDTMAAGLPARGGMEAKSVSDLNALTWGALFGTPGSKAGEPVNIDTALRVSTVLACTRVLAEGVAQLPLHVGSVDPASGAFEMQRQDSYFRLLHKRPNDWMTSFEFREWAMVQAALCNNALAIKNVVGGRVRELLPVPWTHVQPEFKPAWGLVFHVSDPYGAIGTFTRDQVFHLRGWTWDAKLGVNAVHEAREAIGLAIATEAAHARLHKNGARPGGLISVKSGLGDEARERIREAAKRFTGADAFRTMVLDGDAKWTPISMSGVDAQHLETRRFQIEEICRFFRVFPHMVGYTDKTTTFASAESFFQGHVLHTLMPWLRRWKEALERDVLSVGADMECHFDFRELIRGDTQARGVFYASGIANGWLTRNDARRMEQLAPLPGLDEPLVPLNLGPTGNAMDQAEDPAKAKAMKSATVLSMREWLDRYGRKPCGEDEAASFEAALAVKFTRILEAA